jgi:protein-glutamine gamma-glutamyltransferase
MATAVLVGTGAASWSWVLRGSLVGIALVVAVAAVAVLLAAELLAYRLAAVLLAVWLAAGVGAAGVPAGQLLPHAWPSLLARLAGGVGRLTALGSTSGPIGNQSWPLAAWLLGAAAGWVAGAALATSAPSARRRAIAFGLLAAPWIAAVAARHSDRAAWQGAAVLVAGLLWLADRRGAVRWVLVLGLAVGLVSVGITQAIGPRTRWFTRPPASGAMGRFVALDNELTYGPLQDRRSGATMLEVSAAQPALWRMRVLSLFAGLGWRVDSPSPQLPQPAAEPVEVKVVVRGLANDLVVAPGRIDTVHVHADGTASPVAGEAWQLTPPPRRGDVYFVQAGVVRASAEQLQAVPPPTDPRLRAYTSLLPGYGWQSSTVVPLFGQPRDPDVTATLDLTPYGPVAALARRLAAGATRQWEVVARVHRHLLEGGRFRYTTNLPVAGRFPLVDFLLGDHAGDCQHFAGAAALLLRLAGVPARVVVGFATGVPEPGGRLNVRDVDAHAWIEVYFQGYGWVAFNPTPAAGATIPRQLDLLAPATSGGGHDAHGGPAGLGWLTVGAILAALATAGVFVRRRSRRGPVPLGPLLEGLVRRTGGHVQPSSTLAELGVQLARLVGPQTAALAAQTERARFAPDPPAPIRRPRLQLARALANDLGRRRALMVLITPVAARLARERTRCRPALRRPAAKRSGRV